MEIRLASLEDLKSIDRIYNQAISLKMATADTEPYSEEKRLEWFREHDKELFPIYVAIEQSEVLAYMSLSPYRPGRMALRYAVEISYFVDEGQRGKGIGTALLSHGIELARSLDYKFMIAILLGHNLGSIALLKKFEFEEWGRMPGIGEFDGERFDHLYYGREL